MFDRFTDRARKVMALANHEAQRLNHAYIGTEHILVGLVKEGSGVGANVLKNLDVDLCMVRQGVDKLVTSGPNMVTMGKLPQMPRAKMVIEHAINEAHLLKASHVGTEHLLLGLLREREGVAAQVLMNLGLKIDQIREDVLLLLGPDVLPDSGAVYEPVAAAAGNIGRREVTKGDLHGLGPATFEHGRTVTRIIAILELYVSEHLLGAVIAGAGFVLSRNPDMLQAPDVAFVRAERAPQAPLHGYFDGAPDLAVEVLLPDDHPDEISAAVEQWLTTGCRLVWVIDPRNHTVTAHTPDRPAKVLTGADDLSVSDIIPGFASPVSRLFE